MKRQLRDTSALVRKRGDEPGPLPAKRPMLKRSGVENDEYAFLSQRPPAALAHLLGPHPDDSEVRFVWNLVEPVRHSPRAAPPRPAALMPREGLGYEVEEVEEQPAREGEEEGGLDLYQGDEGDGDPVSAHAGSPLPAPAMPAGSGKRRSARLSDLAVGAAHPTSQLADDNLGDLDRLGESPERMRSFGEPGYDGGLVGIGLVDRRRGSMGDDPMDGGGAGLAFGDAAEADFPAGWAREGSLAPPRASGRGGGRGSSLAPEEFDMSGAFGQAREPTEEVIDADGQAYELSGSGRRASLTASYGLNTQRLIDYLSPLLSTPSAEVHLQRDVLSLVKAKAVAFGCLLTLVSDSRLNVSQSAPYGEIIIRRGAAFTLDDISADAAGTPASGGG